MAEQAAGIEAQRDALLVLMQKHMEIKAPTLARAVARAGRRLPRGVRARAARLVEAERLAENPRLARQLDPAATQAAFRELAAHLRTLDPARERRDRWLNTLAVIAFNLMIVTVLIIIWLRWRGLA